MSQIYGDSLVLTKQPTISSASTAYAAGDVVGGVQTLPCGIGADVTSAESAKAQMGSPNNRAPVYLQNISVMEQSAQMAGLDIYFFNAFPTVPADNAAANISNTEISDKCIGVVRLDSTEYRDLASNCVNSQLNVGLLMQPVSSGTVWAIPVIRSATTYAFASGLVFTYGFSRDL